MARDDWRLRIELPVEHAGGLLSRLRRTDAEELADELKQSRVAVTHDEDTVFVYASTSLELERAQQAIDAELADLGVRPREVVRERWLADEERWDSEALPGDAETVAEGYAPWEVRIPCRDHRAARELADRLERDGYGVVRRWSYVIAGCASKEQADELAARLHGEVELGGEIVWEARLPSPFAVFGGLGE